MTDLIDLVKRIVAASPRRVDNSDASRYPADYGDWSPAVAVLQEALVEGVDPEDVRKVKEGYDFLLPGVEDDYRSCGLVALDRILAAKSAKPAVEPSKVDVHCAMDWENKTADITVNGKTTHLTEVVEPSEIAMEVVARLRAQHEGPGYLFVLHDDEAAAIIQRAIDAAMDKLINEIKSRQCAVKVVGGAVVSAVTLSDIAASVYFATNHEKGERK